MIKRILAKELKQAASQFPVVTLTGPRQAGKTTLVQAVFRNYHYVSLELPGQLQLALRPRATPRKDEFWEAAKVCRVANIMRPYLELITLPLWYRSGGLDIIHKLLRSSMVTVLLDKRGICVERPLHSRYLPLLRNKH